MTTMAGGLQAQQPSAVPNPPEAATQTLPHERTISLRHHWTREELTVVYRVGNGYLADALAEINWFMRDYRCNRYTNMDPRLIDLLYSLQQELKPTGPIRVVSGYRSEGYNASLLRAGRTVDPDSQHTQGRAVDVMFPGVPAERVRAAAEARGLGGVGYYPFSGPVFVHVDTGPVRHWAETDPRIRRTMGPPIRRRSPLSLDCTLTTEQVLEQISPEQAYAALPPGAASKPPASDLMRTAIPASAAAFGLPAPRTASSPIAATPAALPDGDGPACTADAMPRLSLPPELSRRPAMKAMQTRQREKKLRAAKVGRKPGLPRRQDARAKPPAGKNPGTVSQSDWEKAAF